MIQFSCSSNVQRHNVFHKICVYFLMSSLHSCQDSMRQDENESVKATFVSSFTLSICSYLISSRLKDLGDMLVNQSRVKGNKMSRMSRLVIDDSRRRVWMSTFVHTLSRSHLGKSLDEYPWREYKPGIKLHAIYFSDMLYAIYLISVQYTLCKPITVTHITPLYYTQHRLPTVWKQCLFHDVPLCLCSVTIAETLTFSHFRERSVFTAILCR